jgi:hypothetical protein
VAVALTRHLPALVAITVVALAVILVRAIFWGVGQIRR